MLLVRLLTDAPLVHMLDPHHLENLRLVNRDLAKSVTKSMRDESVAAALARYRRMVFLSEDTVRIHSSLGRTVIDLTLPSGEIDRNFILRMRLDGRLYRAVPEERRCEMRGEKADLCPYVFHAKSCRLLKAESVYIVRRGTVLDTRIRVCVEERSGRGYIYTLNTCAV
jgi:transposase